ncbi:MAG: DNA repair protein RecN [Alphaproteobacteria bacterium]
MLSRLSIRDVLLIESLELDFRSGLMVLTGETGAGKSILLDSLGLVLGARASSGLLRPGGGHAVVSAAFDGNSADRVADLLDDAGLATEEDELILRRSISRDGRSRAFINDQPASVALLKQVGARLVEIHGQFDTSALMDPTTHRGLLDDAGGHEAELQAVAKAWARRNTCRKALDQAEATLADAAREREFLEQALSALEELAPETGEEQGLIDRRQVLQNADLIAGGLEAALGAVDSEGGVLSRLGEAQTALARIADRAGDAASPAIAALDRAEAELADALAELNSAASDLQSDPGELEHVDQRLFDLRALARKLGVAPDELPGLLDDYAAQLAMLEDGADGLTRLQQDLEQAHAQWSSAADQLTTARTNAATELDAAVMAELPPLKLDRARFVTRITPLPEREQGAEGKDAVGFMVATNPGMPPGAIDRIASGGELSRFMLAIKLALREAKPVSTLVFDEVDSGVGGATAAAIGARLKRLGQDAQILVVTHSPQVAALGQRHWRVEKQAKGDVTTTTVRPLTDTERREEIARMLSGEEISDEARAAADRLIDAA